jgi:hypothetical protein
MKEIMEVENLCKAVFPDKNTMNFDEFKKNCEEITSEMFLSVLLSTAFYPAKK